MCGRSSCSLCPNALRRLALTCGRVDHHGNGDGDGGGGGGDVDVVPKPETSSTIVDACDAPTSTKRVLDPCAIPFVNESHYRPSYNMGPGQWQACMVHMQRTPPPTPQSKPSSSSASLPSRQLVAMRWGFHGWRSRMLINARAESLAQRSSFGPLLRRGQRCVVVVEGFFEWQRRGSKRLPHYFHPEAQPVLLLAGLWRNELDRATGVHVPVCVVVTTAASPALAHVHDRMPAILQPQHVDTWLDPATPEARALDLLQPCRKGLHGYAVSRAVSFMENQGPECITPLSQVSGPLAHWVNRKQQGGGRGRGGGAHKGRHPKRLRQPMPMEAIQICDGDDNEEDIGTMVKACVGVHDDGLEVEERKRRRGHSHAQPACHATDVSPLPVLPSPDSGALQRVQRAHWGPLVKHEGNNDGGNDGAAYERCPWCAIRWPVQDLVQHAILCASRGDVKEENV